MSKSTEKVGGFGRYQLVTAGIVGYYGMLVAHYSLQSVFTSVQESADFFGR